MQASAELETGIRRIPLSWILIGWGTYVFISINQSYLFYRIIDRPPRVWYTPITHACLLGLVWIIFTPIIIRLARRFRIERGTRSRALTIHLPLAFGFAAADVLIDRALGPFLGFGPPGAEAMAQARNAAAAFQAWASFVFAEGALQDYLSEVDLNSFYYFAIVAAIHAFDYQHFFRARRLRESQLEAEAANARLSALKMQVQPHFLFNALNAINALMHEDRNAAEHMLRRLADLLRLTLRDAERNEVTLERELEFVEAYLDIQQTRFADRLRVQIDVDPAALHASLPVLVLQPLVENAVRHGIAPRARGGTVSISAERRDGWLRLVVRDDGVGLPTAFDEGIGLSNTRARLRQAYGDHHRFRIDAGADGGVTVTLEIPLGSFVLNTKPITEASGAEVRGAEVRGAEIKRVPK